MAFTKQAPFTKKVTDLPDKPSPTYTASDIKVHFQTPADELMTTLNNAIDKLNDTTDGASGADNVGATGFDGLASTVQALLDYLKANKTDLTGDHKGTWNGFTPSQADPGISSVVDQHTTQLADIKHLVMTVKYYGAIGDGLSHPLSEKYTTLTEAQAVYPHATALTDEIDWCAIQKAINNDKRVDIPIGDYRINKTLTVTTSITFRGSNREETVITQLTDNIPFFHVEGWFHEFSNFSITYANQQIKTSTNAIGFRLKSVSQSLFESISIFNTNKGIAPDTTNSWNYTLSNIYVEGFSLSGIIIPRGSGVTLDNVYICKPYLTAYSGLEIQGGDYIVCNQVNVEGWYDNADPNYGQGLYEHPILISEARVIFNGLSFEAVSLAKDSGFITTKGLSTETSNIIINQCEMYHNRLDSALITRGAIVYTQHPTFATVNGLKMTVVVKDLATNTSSDVNNSLLITDTDQTRAEFTGVTGGTIVGTNEYNGSYGSAGYATNYTYVTNNDANLGVALQKVNTTVYTQRFKKEVITPKLTLTNGGIQFTAVEVPSTDPNHLDDYREGTFTPGILFNGFNTGITTSKNEGTYTKVGRLVYFNIHAILTSKGTATGNLIINGIPYNSSKKHGVTVSIKNGNSIDGHIQGSTRDTVSKNIDFEIVTPTGVVPLTNTHFTDTTEIIVSGFYQI